MDKGRAMPTARADVNGSAGLNYIAELEREKAHSDGQTAAAQYWMSRAVKAERVLLERTIALVQATGGEIIVHLSDFNMLPICELVIDDQPHDMTVRFKVRQKIPLLPA